MTRIKFRTSSNSDQIGPCTLVLLALEYRKLMFDLVRSIARLVFYPIFMQLAGTGINSRKSSNSGQFGLSSSELITLECKNIFIDL